MDINLVSYCLYHIGNVFKFFMLFYTMSIHNKKVGLNDE